MPKRRWQEAVRIRASDYWIAVDRVAGPYTCEKTDTAGHTGQARTARLRRRCLSRAETKSDCFCRTHAAEAHLASKRSIPAAERSVRCPLCPAVSVSP